MPISFRHTHLVRAAPALVFSILDDFSKTPQWLPPCVRLEKVGTGPNSQGDKLRYVYKYGGVTGEMNGVIIQRVPGERLHCQYTDPKLDVNVDLSIAPAQGGSEITHNITVEPKGFFAGLISPVIRSSLQEETLKAAENLRKLVETAHPS